MNRQREWMSPKEVRELLSVGRCKGYGILSDRIAAYSKRKAHRVRRRDVERWLGGHGLTSGGCAR